MPRNETQEAYIPVAVTFDADRKVIDAQVDFEGAPWTFIDKEPNVWLVNDDDPDGAWVRSDIELEAIAWVAKVLADGLGED